MFVDGLWGGFIHVGEHMLKDGRLGVAGKYILTPSHHRVHHARNPLYMDTNFCNLLNIWDRVFRNVSARGAGSSGGVWYYQANEKEQFLRCLLWRVRCVDKGCVQGAGN